jgi:hypothetical protein
MDFHEISENKVKPLFKISVVKWQRRNCTVVKAIVDYKIITLRLAKI